MAFSIDDFDKIWASTSPLTPYTFSESNYKQGWNFVGSTPPSRQMWDSWLKNTDEKMKWLCDHNIGFPVGYEFFSINPNIQDGTLPLLGGEYSREAYASLWEWVQTQTGYLVTESAWVSMSNSQGGNVPFYSDGDGSTTFRVPSLKCWIKGKDGAETVGTYLDAGLPNVAGSLLGATTLSAVVDGALGWEQTDATNYSMNYQSGSMRYGRITFDASSSNSIYGIASTVQPNSIVGMWLVQAYATVHDAGRIDVKDYIDEQINRRSADFLVGSVQAFAGSTTPTGWLFCDGSAVSRTDYADLYAVIGDTYGAGDGSTTFNLPNLVDKFVEGSATAGTEKTAGLPNIKGEIGFRAFDADNLMTVNGLTPKAFSATQGNGATFGWRIARNDNSSAQQKCDTLYFNASGSNSIYSDGVSTVQPPAVTMRYIIKY